jgi:ATP-dependent DNA helicase RecQ
MLDVIKRFAAANKLESKVHLKKAKPVRKERTPKVKGTSSTMEVSYNMLKDGLSVEQISAERNLAISTIETHLAAFVASGDLDIHKMVPSHKLQPIIDAIKASGQSYAIKPVKDLLPEEFTYGEIRMALEYYKRQIK